jgi:hypothetical protein
MRIDPKDHIAGVPTLAVRGFFNSVGGRLFSEARLAEELGLVRQQAQALLDRLLAEGYVEYYNRPTLDSTPELHGPWRATIKGVTLAGVGIGVGESSTAVEPEAGAPQFPLVPHGYDRQLVDLRVAELVAQLDKERQQASDLGQAAWATLVKAERERERINTEAAQAAEQVRAQADRYAKATMDTAHAQAAERIRTAEERADQLEQAAEATLANAQRERERLETEAAQAAGQVRAQADRDAGQVRAQADRDAGQVRAQADRDAKELLSRAQNEADLARLKASHERMLLQAEAEQLAALRQTTVEQLQRMYTPLGLTLVNSDRALEVKDEGGQVESEQLDRTPTATDGHHVEAKQPPRPSKKGSQNSAAT